MIKVLLDGQRGRKLLLLGLTREVADQLLGGKPLVVELESYGIEDFRVGICFGETQDDIFKDIKENLGVEVQRMPPDEQIGTDPAAGR